MEQREHLEHARSGRTRGAEAPLLHDIRRHFPHETPAQSLTDSVDQGLGTGFSSTVALDSTNASWSGLLSAGAEYLKDNGIADELIYNNIKSDIALGASKDGTFLLTAGQKIIFLELWSVAMTSGAAVDKLATIKLDRALTRALQDEARADDVQMLLQALMLKRHATKPASIWTCAKSF